MLELKRSFAKKLGLLKKSRFLRRSFRRDLYFKVTLPSVTYGLKLIGVLAAPPTYFNPWKGSIAGLRDLFLICPKTWRKWTDGRPLTQLSNLTSNLSSRVLLTTELQTTSKSVDKLVLSSTSSIPLPGVPCYQTVMFSNSTSTDFPISVLQSVSSNFPENFKRIS